MSSDPWHFTRHEMAESTLGLLSGKLASAVTLFAPRRTGKTEFLLKDLGPLAESKGHRVVYVSFWQAPLAPLAVLLNALEGAVRKGSLADRVRHLALGLTPKLKLSGKLPGASADMEIDLTRLTGKPPAELLLYLDDLLGRLARASKPTLLLLDEVQELARNADNHSLVASLRTSLDKHRNGLATVFTGSSREGLQAMFSARQAPFFHFATPVELPKLDGAFVDHLLGAFGRASRRRLDPAIMHGAFAELNQSPFLFRGLLELLLVDPGLEVAAAMQRLRDRVAVELRYPQTWLSLTPIQRAVAIELARDTEKPFAQTTRARIGRLTGEGPPTIARVQTALRRLASIEVAVKWEERWLIEDAEMKRWILARPPQELT